LAEHGLNIMEFDPDSDILQIGDEQYQVFESDGESPLELRLVEVIEYCVCQDGDKFYIQTDPEDEEWIASFNSEEEADEYCELLNKKQEVMIL